MRVRCLGDAGVAARAAARLDLEVVAAHRLRTDPLPGSGLPISLGRSLVGLHLRHGYCPCWAGASAVAGAAGGAGALAATASPMVSTASVEPSTSPFSLFLSGRFSSGAI